MAAMAESPKDLVEHIDQPQSSCLNFNDEHVLENCLRPEYREEADKFLQSDCDAELLVTIRLRMDCKINDIVIKGPADRGPSSCKVFVNVLDGFDFASAAELKPDASFELSADKTNYAIFGTPAYVKFQAVSSITLFFPENHEDGDETVVDKLAVSGWPVEFKSGEDGQTAAQKASLQRSMGGGMR